MALTEKDVFYALLHNHGTNLRALCEQSHMPYHSLIKRIKRGTLRALPPDDIMQLCKPLGVSYEDFSELMRKARYGEFPDDFLKEKIVLEVRELSRIERRTEAMMVTADEKKLLELIRSNREKAVKAAVEILLETGLSLK